MEGLVVGVVACSTRHVEVLADTTDRVIDLQYRYNILTLVA